MVRKILSLRERKKREKRKEHGVGKKEKGKERKYASFL